MKGKSLYIALGLATLVILILSFRANPHLYNFDSHYFDIVQRPPIASSTQYKELQTHCEPTSQYRYDSKRTGLAPTSAQPKAKANIIEKIFPLNVDIHGASKSSPTVDDSGVYVGSDTGWFFKMDHSGGILWSFYIPGSGNGIHGSAALDEKKVYFGAYNGFMYALNKSNGELVWATPVGDFIGASPLLADGGLFITAETGHPNGLIARLDCNT